MRPSLARENRFRFALFFGTFWPAFNGQRIVLIGPPRAPINDPIRERVQRFTGLDLVLFGSFARFSFWRSFSERGCGWTHPASGQTTKGNDSGVQTLQSSTSVCVRNWRRCRWFGHRLRQPAANRMSTPSIATNEAVESGYFSFGAAGDVSVDHFGRGGGGHESDTKVLSVVGTRLHKESPIQFYVFLLKCSIDLQSSTRDCIGKRESRKIHWLRPIERFLRTCLSTINDEKVLKPHWDR